MSLSPSNADQPHRAPATAAPGGQSSNGPSLSLTSQQLMQGHKAVAITHNGTTYRLQATRLGKLILTK